MDLNDWELWEKEITEDEDSDNVRLEAQCPTCELWFWADGDNNIIQHVLGWHKESRMGMEIIDMIGESYA